MNAPPLDPRLHAFRRDLADMRLRGQVEAAHFADGDPMVVAAPVADMRTQPSADAGLGTQILLGERLQVFERDEGWAWVQAERDGYVGYVPEEVLAPVGDAPTHRVRVPRTFAYAGADLKRAARACLSMGALVAVKSTMTYRDVDYARLADESWCLADHLAPVDASFDDFVAVAERLAGTPYLWGGTSAFGLDCSGLVQLAMLMAGRIVARDSDMQEASIGEPIAPDAPLMRGDLVFWRGHVGIMRNERTLLHANASTMDVADEPLERALARIAPLYGEPSARRRP